MANAKGRGRWWRDPGKERYWREVLARWRRSGLSIRAFCFREVLSEASFYAWRRELDLRDRESRPNVEAVSSTAPLSATNQPSASPPEIHRPPTRHIASGHAASGHAASGHAASNHADSGRVNSDRVDSVGPAAARSALDRSGAPLFVPVRIESTESGDVASDPIRIVLSDGREVHVGARFDSQALKRVLSVLQETQPQRGDAGASSNQGSERSNQGSERSNQGSERGNQGGARC